jgi:hypothetical protein
VIAKLDAEAAAATAARRRRTPIFEDCECEVDFMISHKRSVT